MRSGYVESDLNCGQDSLLSRHLSHTLGGWTGRFEDPAALVALELEEGRGLCLVLVPGSVFRRTICASGLELPLNSSWCDGSISCVVIWYGWCGVVYR